jgi:hypothetical protein
MAPATFGVQQYRILAYRGVSLSKLDQKTKFSSIDEQYVLARAYVPEHLPSLMALLSKGTLFLVGDYLGISHDNWLILVGYPLSGEFSQVGCELAVGQAREAIKPEVLWYIGPEIPTSLLECCRERSSDNYYILQLDSFKFKSPLRRVVEKASATLKVEQEHDFSRDHQNLVNEFLHRQHLSAMVAELYRLMPEYLAISNSARLLSARDRHGRLSAFYVIESAAPAFDVYLLGCYSQKNYVPYASDLLFSAMVELAREQGKNEINLGLGVNDGIRRFKQKWGGVPGLKYEYCECYFGLPRPLSILDSFLEGKC